MVTISILFSLEAYKKCQRGKLYVSWEILLYDAPLTGNPFLFKRKVLVKRRMPSRLKSNKNDSEQKTFLLYSRFHFLGHYIHLHIGAFLH